MPAIISLSVPRCWTGATFWKRLSIAAWAKRRMPTSGRSSRSGPRRGEFRTVDHAGVGQQYTTAAMVRMEREIVARMQEGNQRGMSDPMLVSPQIRIATEDRHPEMNASQRQAVDQVFLSREKMVGLDGVAGAGKTIPLFIND
jgi:hypothetical protein